MMGLLDSFSLMLGDALVERIPWLKRAFLVRVSLQEPLYKAWRQTLGTTHAMRRDRCLASNRTLDPATSDAYQDSTDLLRSAA